MLRFLGDRKQGAAHGYSELAASAPRLARAGIQLGRRCRSARASIALSMRLISPLSTLPGPHSAMRVAPPAASACTHSVQRTGRYSWRCSAPRIVVQRVVTARLGVLHHRNAPAAATGSKPCARPARSAASRISAQCEGTDTASLIAFFTPSSASRASARSTASAWPAITSWPGELKLAGDTTCPCATSSHTAAICASSPPRMAAMAPTPAGTAACISRPRSATSAAASCSDSAPAQTSALYSPRL